MLFKQIKKIALVVMAELSIKTTSAFAIVEEQIESVADISGVPKNTFYGVVLAILLWLLRIFTIAAVIAFIVSGIMFLLAGTNKDMAEKAKSGVTYSIIGITVALLAYIIIFLINDLLWGGWFS